MPTAERACRPFSPNTSTIRSEKPLMTLGWSPKLSTAFTMPRTFTTRFTLSRLPSAVRAEPSRLMPTSRATLYASSVDMSRPTLPRVSGWSPTRIGPWPDRKSRLPTRTAGM